MRTLYKSLTYLVLLLIVTCSFTSNAQITVSKSHCDWGHTTNDLYRLQYSITVTNTGVDSVNNIQVVDDLLAGLAGNDFVTSVFNTSVTDDFIGTVYTTADFNSTVDGTVGAGSHGELGLMNMSALDTLPPGRSVIITLCVDLDETAISGLFGIAPYLYTNTATASATNVLTSAPYTDVTTDDETFFRTNSHLASGLTVSNTNPPVNLDGTYDFSYFITITNPDVTDATATAVQWTDNWDHLYANGVPINTLVVTQTSGVGMALNPAFDGGSGVNGSGITLLNAAQSLAPGQTATFQVDLNVGPTLNLGNNRCTIANLSWLDGLGVAQSDESRNNAAMHPDDQCSCSSTCIQFNYVANVILTKTVNSVDYPTSGIRGNWDVTFDFVYSAPASNTVELTDLYVLDDMASQFCGSLVGVPSAPVVTNVDATDPPDPNATYDGATGAGPLSGVDLLDANIGTDTLDPGQSFGITMIAEINAALMCSPNMTNTASAGGADPNSAVSTNPSVQIVIPVDDCDGDGILDVDDADDDNDGILDVDEGSGDSDGDGIDDACDLDSDNDGIYDIIESGGTDANGDGVIDYPVAGDPLSIIDNDWDGVDDSIDAFDNGDAFGFGEVTSGTPITLIDTDGDSVNDYLDLDSDNDGISDLAEIGLGSLDTNNDGSIDGIDTDGDGLINVPAIDNNNTIGGNAPGVLNFDGDGQPDHLDLDSDNDGIADVTEDGNGALDGNNDGVVDGTDTDGDGVINVPAIDANSTFGGTAIGNTDFDGDGLPNSTDIDSDNDGITDVIESGVAALDANNDGMVDGTDADGDGLLSSVDPNGTFGGAPTSNPTNTDSNGSPDYLDIDADDDGIVDNIEGQTTAGYSAPSGNDLNQNGLDDQYESVGFAGINPTNTDNTDNPDYQDLDSDNDVVPDAIEGWDTDGDYITNTTPTGNDADGDGLDDAYDVDDANVNPTNGTTPGSYPDVITPGGDRDWRQQPDFDGDGIPDDIDLDDDNDGVTDIEEICGLGAIDYSCVGGDPFADDDGDGIPNYLDADFCTLNANGVCSNMDTDGDGIIDMYDLDSDNDGIFDLYENVTDPTTLAALDPNGDGIVDGPYGANGLADGAETAPDSGTPTIHPLDTDGDGVPNAQDLDSDNDGIFDVVESGNTTLDGNNDGIVDGADTDGDGIINNPTIDPNNVFGGTSTGNTDTDGDGVPNSLDLDSDNDGINDLTESGTNVPDANGDGIVDGTDTDGDGIINDPLIDNNSVAGGNGIASVDTDGDNTPDYLDLDSDNDGINDLTESGADISTVDANGDGIIDGTDTDGDGIQDLADANAGFGDDNITAVDTDGDSTPDYLDLDSDNDGINDLTESGADLTTVDANGDGIIDGTDADGDGIQDLADTNAGFGDDNVTTLDSDGDNIPNYLDLDSDNDGISDLVESGADAATVDTDGDGIIDGNDTDGDGIQDLADANAGFGDDNIPALDTDNDGLIDAMDIDSDNDGITDIIEAGGTDTDNDGHVDYGTAGDPTTMADADGDGMADVVDVDNSGTAWPTPDSDNDGLADYIDIDADNDGIVDNVEGQSTASYTPPTGQDTDGDGLDNAYDSDDQLTVGIGGGTGTSIDPVNTDLSGNPDYLDLDSDNDLIPDNIEGWDYNNDGIADITASGNDFDNDGLDDVYDTVLLNGTTGLSGTNASNNTDPLFHPDLDLPNIGDQDWRENDNDGDGINDWADVDDDNDGIPDWVEICGPGATDFNCIGGDPALDADDDGIMNFMDADFCTLNVHGVCDNLDTDGDGIIDVYDLDSDNDGLSDIFEGGGVDTNNDGLVDELNADGTLMNDADNDGWADNEQLPNPPDFDGDGQPDFQDLDSDNDGIADVVEAGGVDTDGDGKVDDLASNGTLISDTDGDGWTNTLPITAPENTDGDVNYDHLDLDSDNDGIPDVVEAGGIDSDGDGEVDGFTDADGDGWDDNNPLTGTADFDGDGVPNHEDLDSDNDGIADIVESGNVDTDNNGTVDGFSDPDGDGWDQPNGVSSPVDTDGDGNPDYLDLDSDNDGIYDVTESDPTNPNLDPDGDGIVGTGTIPLDTDGDGLPDIIDTDNGNGLTPPVDTDGDGVPDFQDIDSDNDGITDIVEAGLGNLDTDGDGYGDGVDTDGDGIQDILEDPAGVGVYGGVGQSAPDWDGDGIPDYLDLDSDNDGIPDVVEAGNTDIDGDGQIDNFTDTDGDGWDDNNGVINPIDTDGDGHPDFLDLDSDNDGIPDVIEAGGSDTNFDGMVDNFTDTDGNGWDDNNGISNPVDTDGDGIPDYHDLDSDNDGIADVIESGGGVDLNNDGLVDGFTDLDGDGWDDNQSGQDPRDTDGDGIPDYQDVDSDGDGFPDSVEWDFDGDGIGPDDCDEDGIPDYIDDDRCEIFVPQGLTPNGDGYNETLTIPGIENYPGNNFQVFNRWGNLVFEMENYDQSWGGECNQSGCINDGVLPTGTYYYVVSFNDVEENISDEVDALKPVVRLEPITGFIYIKR